MHSSRRLGESCAVMMTMGKLAPAIFSDCWTSVPPQTWHLQVEHQTIRPIKMPRLKKFYARIERARSEARRLQYAGHRLANRFLVVDYCNHGSSPHSVSHAGLFRAVSMLDIGAVSNAGRSRPTHWLNRCAGVSKFNVFRD